jgi:heme-degrading monooxygenase HmoA
MYVIVWEFLVEPEKIDAFVAAYKSTGAWATLFAETDGYLGTELLSSTASDNEAKFITIDRWVTAEDFTRFQQRFGAEYRTLDTALEKLTTSERKLGVFIDTV